MATIYEIQGAGQTSPLLGETVTAEGGIVTAVVDNGFYIQDPNGDDNPSTSDGLFVFTGSPPNVNVGDELNVTGEVSEFQPGGVDNRNLSATQIAFPETIAVITTGNSLPDPVILGEGGRIPPSENINDDAFTNFNPSEAGIDFFESLEGMLVTAQAAVAVGPTNRFGEIFTVVNNGSEATGISDRGTLNISPDDFNPEKVQIDFESDLLPDFDFPQVNVGDQLGDITGVISYDFGNFQIQPTEPFSVTPANLEPEITTIAAGDQNLTVATYNVFNLDPKVEDVSFVDGEDPGEIDDDVADGRFSAIAQQIVNNLETPDIIALQEVQDNDGAEITDVSAADATLQLLVDEIAKAGGPTYEFIDTPGIVPSFIDSDGNLVRPTGGQPGGNIRNGFLYNSNRVSLVEGSVEPLTNPQDQAQNPDNPFFGSRIPLSATFEFNGEQVTVINNHFSSKGGSSAILGLDQPFEELQNGALKDLPQATLDELDPEDRFVNGSYNEREAQAEAVKAYVDNLDADNIIALGDFNEFEFVDPVQEILGSSLNNLTETIPEDERYSFIFQGNSQQLDHILVSDALATSAQLDIVHTNVEFADQASDHEPLLASLNLSGDSEMAINLNAIGTFETGVFDEGAAEIVA
ncbi:MAG: nuclease, partial [Cyanobacteria bacterium]|nr:nuclease [Cyanobacteria bacterium GSL.Bin21]